MFRYFKSRLRVHLTHRQTELRLRTLGCNWSPGVIIHICPDCCVPYQFIRTVQPWLLGEEPSRRFVGYFCFACGRSQTRSQMYDTDLHHLFLEKLIHANLLEFLDRVESGEFAYFAATCALTLKQERLAQLGLRTAAIVTGDYNESLQRERQRLESEIVALQQECARLARKGQPVYRVLSRKL